MWDKSPTKYASLVKCSNFRLQATKFSFPSGNFLLFNTYFPCDPQTVRFNETELLSLLAEMKNILYQEGCLYNLISGDLNCHFLQKSTFTLIIENFFKDIQFNIFWGNPDHTPGQLVSQVDFTHCQSRDKQISTSIIDHSFRGKYFQSLANLHQTEAGQY